MAAPSQPKLRTIRGMDAEQRRAQRREQLLAAAFELFARDGYANTSIEQICQTAYVGNKAFYDLFDSKEDCYIAPAAPGVRTDRSASGASDARIE